MAGMSCNPLPNLDECKTEILKKQLLQSTNSSLANHCTNNVVMNSLRPTMPSSMLMSSLQGSPMSMQGPHMIPHSMAPVKIHANNTFPLQLSSMHMPVGANMNMQLSGNSVPIHLNGPSVSLPIQVTTTSMPVQLTAGETINVPIQVSGHNSSIQISTPGLTALPLLSTTSQPLLMVGGNSRGMETSSDLTISHDSRVKVSCPSSAPVQLPNSTNSPIHLQLPSAQLRGVHRPMPHMVYIQTPTGLKAVTSSEVISQATSTGNPRQIVVRKPMANAPSLQLFSNVSKPNIAPKVTITNKSSLLAPANPSQPIVIQKPKPTDKVIIPSAGGKSVTYIGAVKKMGDNTKKVQEGQSILLPNNQINSTVNVSNQKLIITAMNVPKVQNTKMYVPVNLPHAVMSKGPVIISNGPVHNEPQANITIRSDNTVSIEKNEMISLPLPKGITINGSENTPPMNISTEIIKSEKGYPISIPGSRAEPIGEQEYTLSIPETNASLNDDIYTVSIADEEGGHANETSFTLAIPEKGMSFINKNIMEPNIIPAPAILRRSYSDNTERAAINMSVKRRISLCTENMLNRNIRLNAPMQKSMYSIDAKNNNDDHRVPSLYCDEKLDKELDANLSLRQSHPDQVKVNAERQEAHKTDHISHKPYVNNQPTLKRERRSTDSTNEEDPPGLMWNDGVAMLQGSGIQFCTNEFGLIDIVHNSDGENYDVPTGVPYGTPKTSVPKSNKKNSPDDLYRCEICGCHGMAVDFITPNFCSHSCQNEAKQIQKKKDKKEKLKESLENIKKRHKLKRILMKKQSETDMYEKDEKLLLKMYDSLPPDSRLSTEELDNDKYPWMCGKNGFSWMKYLEHCKAKAAPVKLFKEAFPYNKNGFKVGMRMEAIDPRNPSYFCVVSVAEVQGYRMRLHFDDYPEVYDYWVNADSLDIFPAGWCEKNGRSLKPPSNCNTAVFSWPLYLRQMKAIAAQKPLFPHLSTTVIKPNGFRIGMKLEAEDRRNDCLCVATVADSLDNRILVTFDSWGDTCDYWVDPTSPYIHPVGWAEANELRLTPPCSYKDPEFSWSKYLADTGAAPAPSRAFKPRPPNGFRVGMKLEVVDKRVPFLIRVASISEIKNHQVKVSFDGWPSHHSYWLDDDCPDLHPVGWCLKTGHPLEPPLTELELEVLGSCGVLGCKGLGSTRGGAHKCHSIAAECPYRSHLTSPTPERIARPKPIPQTSPTPSTTDSKRGRPSKHKSTDPTKTENLSDEGSEASCVTKRWRHSSKEVEASITKEYDPRTSQASHCAIQLDPILVQLELPTDPRIWDEKDVQTLVKRLAGPDAAEAMKRGRLTGAELLMASREELVDCLALRLGPAIKLYAAITLLRDTVI